MAKNQKLCFAIMPFGEKLDLAGKAVKFDDIYRDFLKPAIQTAGLKPVRCDEVEESGLIHRKMLEHIWNADVAVVDISLLNPNVFYELGVRHSLRNAVTVLIRRRGTKLPFNVANLNAIEYDETDPDTVALATEKIVQFIEHGLRSMDNDSLVHEILDLDIRRKPSVITRCNVYDYNVLHGSGNTVCAITGDIQNVRGIDIWVNSENTNMQMARFYDWSISSMIRFLGAKKDVLGDVIEDSIFNELNGIMGDRHSVDQGRVIPTTPGALEETHGVKQIFHAAAVYGSIGGGYLPIERLADCVTNSLRLADSLGTNKGWQSILFPLFGAGTSKSDLRHDTQSLIEAALAYMANNPASVIKKIYFLAWSTAELEMYQSLFAGFNDLESRPKN